MNISRIKVTIVACFLFISGAILANTPINESIHFYNSGEYRKAYQSFKISFENSGDPVSARYLGLMHMNGKGVEKDFDLGVSYIELAAGNGDKLSQNLLEKYPSLNPKNKQLLPATEVEDNSKLILGEIIESNESSQLEADIESSLSKDIKSSLESSRYRNSFYGGVGFTYINSNDGSSMWEIPFEIGTSPLKDGLGGSLGIAVGLLDLGIENVDSHFTFNLGGGISYSKSLAKNGFLSRFVPRAAARLEWEYFDNEHTTEYTTGYDFSPLEYSDYYWRYYETYTTGDTFSFWNHSYDLGLNFVVFEDVLYLSYTYRLFSSFEDLDDSTSSTFSITFRSPFKGEEGIYFTLSYSDSNNYFDSPFWSFFIANHF